jgi:LPS-assembly lipoprotein
MTTDRRLFVLAVSNLLMTFQSVCCFLFRGTTPESKLSFDSVYLEAARGTPLERDLRNAILAQGNTVLATDQKAATVTLRILSEGQEKKILTLNAQGQVREFSLLYRINFEVADKENKKLLKPSELALQAFLSYSESQALAKETEERMTYNDLRRDAVSQVMRQLSRVKPGQ